MIKRAATILLLVVPPLLVLLPLCGGTPGGGARDAAAAPGTSPRVRLRISAMLEGRLEPCGCASGQMGGLARRVFHLEQERNYDLLIEGGNLVKGGTTLDAQKLMTTLLVLSSVPYHAVGIGPAELRLPMRELNEYLEGYGIAAVASDLKPADGADWRPRPFVEREAGASTVRVASLALSKPDSETAARLELLPPQRAWQEAMAGCAPRTYRVLLAHGGVDEVRRLAELTPRPDLVIGVTAQVPEPPSSAERVAGVPVVFPGIRGRMLLDVVLTRMGGEPRLTKYRIVRLKGSETVKGAMEDPETKGMILAHRHDVKDLGIRERMAGRLETPGGRKYVGSALCGDCHEEAYEIWKKTTHAHAWETLEKVEGKRYPWPVTHYPDCVSCHVVGYGYESGFVNPEKTPELKGVGCEECHGPGSEHIEKETADTILRGKAADCRTCHDFEQSPDFDWGERWKKIEHW